MGPKACSPRTSRWSAEKTTPADERADLRRTRLRALQSIRSEHDGHDDGTKPGRAGRTVVAAALAWLLAGCFGAPLEQPGTADAAPETPDGTPTFQLAGVVAGVVGLGVLVQNHSPYELSNVEIVINETPEGGGYRFTAEHIDANTTRTYLARSFRDAAGQSLNPMDERIQRFSIYADTERGRGVWKGRYGPETIR